MAAVGFSSASRLITTRPQGGAIVRDVKKDLEGAVKKMRAERSKAPRAKLRSEVSILRKELTARQKKSVRDLLVDAQV